MTKLKQEQLDALRSLQQQSAQAKIEMADAEIAKLSAVGKYRAVQEEYKKLEKTLAEEYGENCTINIDTGEVTAPDAGDKQAPNAEMSVVK
jgi:hypothetical protein